MHVRGHGLAAVSHLPEATALTKRAKGTFRVLHSTDCPQERLRFVEAFLSARIAEFL